MKKLFHTLLTLILFSIWAGFALLIVNPYLKDQLPGYTIGRICIWEVVALIIAALIAQVIIKKWGLPEIIIEEGQRKFQLNAKYVYLFLAYFLLALLTGVWQFWLFSQKF